MFLFFLSTLDRKQKFLQWQDHIHLHPVDLSYDELKEYNDDTDFNPADLNNKELRKNLTKLFYKYMKRVAEISNHNIARNSDAYMAGSGQIDPDNEFSALLHFRTSPPLPFLLMILVQTFMLIKNHKEPWV